MLKSKELRDKSNEELIALNLELSRKIFGTKNELKVNRKLEKPHLLRELKKDRARVLTILSEKSDAAHRG